MLNLLPPGEKKILLQEWQKKLLLLLAFEFSVFLACVLLVFLSIEFHILGKISDINFLFNQTQSESQSSDFSYFSNIISKYNRELLLIDYFYKNQKFASGAINTLLSVPRPDGLYFTNFSLQSQLQPGRIKVNVAGNSGTRDNLLTFKKNIEAEKKIENVNFSSESWISQKDINFNITLDILNEK